MGSTPSRQATAAAAAASASASAQRQDAAAAASTTDPASGSTAADQQQQQQQYSSILRQPSGSLAATSAYTNNTNGNSTASPASAATASPELSASLTPSITPTSPRGSARDVDIDDVIARLLDSPNHPNKQKYICIKTAEIINICNRVRTLLMSQPVLLELSPPINIAGDIHGQFRDLLRVFDACGYPPDSNYLFLGDYVDRGKNSLETILLLFCYKLKYPENFFILRGNHESASVNRVYGFFDECKRRSSLKVWKVFTDVFNCLPIAAIVAGKIFCLHGGLSPSLITLDDIRAIQRPTDVPDFGLLNDLLWSDPSEFVADWEDNERGVSYCFGSAIVKNFLQKFDFDLVARAHMVVESGYEFFAERQLVTIFTAPNYCGEFDNKGAIMRVDENLLCSFEILEPKSFSAMKGRRPTSPPAARSTAQK